MSTYWQAGVNIEEGERAVELMKVHVATAQRSESIGEIGGFAGQFDASALKKFTHPILVSATDGVGTKTEIARLMNKYDSIGEDLVAMVVDDLVVCGAEPLFMTDYIATGKVFPEKIAEIISGIARGCKIANTALVGGETAEHPGLLAEDEFDLAGAATGVVEKSAVLGEARVLEGDFVIAMASSGLHANGYSLARHIINTKKLDLDKKIDSSNLTLGQYLLTPTKIYALDCLSLMARLTNDLHALSHITGGGIAKNTARVIPSNLMAIIDRSTWQLPSVMQSLAKAGQVDQSEIELTFNCGIGMLAIVDVKAKEKSLSHLKALGINAWVAGVITKRKADVGAQLANNYQ